MKRQVIKIDQEKCVGCGLCVNACHEGAIGMVNGKAVLLRDDYCDGLGNCLPVCPTGAISFEEREAVPFDAEAVRKNMVSQVNPTLVCPGTAARAIHHEAAAAPRQLSQTTAPEQSSQLRQWPVQIKLVPVNAPYFDGANLLIAADCSAYACGNFHERFMRHRITLIGCPKLDEGEYSEKLTAILKNNNIKSVTVARMEVPCCGGIEHAVKVALQNCGKMIPWQIVIITTDGQIME